VLNPTRFSEPYRQANTQVTIEKSETVAKKNVTSAGFAINSKRNRSSPFGEEEEQI
jgi:hypothetical protein